MLALALVPMLSVGCKDPGTAGEPHITGTTAPGSSAAPPQPVQLELSIDGHRPTKVNIPTTEPATIERDAWPKQLGFFASTRSADEIELEIALLPKDPTHAPVDLAAFKRQIAASRAMKPGQSITLNPGTTFPRDGFGDSTPDEIRITWIR
jgi:hypothetical protein